MTVIITPHSGPTQMSEILPMFKTELSTSFADLANYLDSSAIVNGKEHGEIQYESTSNGNLMHFLQILYITGGKDVQITFTDRADHFALNADIKSIRASVLIQAK